MDLPQRKNMRKHWYDYNNSWSYFITICTQNREHYFWEIQDHKMILNGLWKYVWNCRNDIPNHFSFVTVGEFICMPDHVHGILTINQNNRRNAITAHLNNQTTDPNDNQTNRRDGLSSVRPKHPNDGMILDRTKNISSLQGAVSWSLGSIIRGFKIGVTKFANQNSISFARQSRFYDHIILNKIEYYFIEQYIRNNPKNR